MAWVSSVASEHQAFSPWRTSVPSAAGVAVTTLPGISAAKTPHEDSGAGVG